MAKERRKPRKLGLWIPMAILKMTFLSGDEKLLYAYIYSFQERGCWQTDEQISKALGCCDRTVRRYLANCKKAGLFKVTGERSKYRKIWAEANPKFKAVQKQWAKEHGQNCPSRRTNLAADDGQNCPTTNKDTNKRTNKQHGSSPLSTEGQAHMPLRDKQQQLEEHRMRKEAMASIEQLKHNFGSDRRRWTPKLTLRDLEQRKQTQLKALLGNKKVE